MQPTTTDVGGNRRSPRPDGSIALEAYSALALAPPQSGPSAPPAGGRIVGNNGSWRGVAAFAALFGGLIILAATVGLTIASHADPGEPPTSVNAPESHSDVSVAELTYAPGHSSGWHLHYGVHSVVVLEGTLTIYDETCGRQDYGPGSSYLGGSLPHLARNEGPDELRVVVTSVYRLSATGEHGSAVPAPAGCEPR